MIAGRHHSRTGIGIGIGAELGRRLGTIELGFGPVPIWRLCRTKKRLVELGKATTGDLCSRLVDLNWSSSMHNSTLGELFRPRNRAIGQLWTTAQVERSVENSG